ncbi:hypothetical protein [Feifania hominis]|uniref:Uncharacterized protein n=1 Tax=Feifania hominis TaxID=2763660 RepID=A0A926DHC3_9FIRM|nr:hypothetical protein [Feifania hominis]MBC8537090.1 hypothetical protein [Feifania hominis]
MKKYRGSIGWLAVAFLALVGCALSFNMWLQTKDLIGVLYLMFGLMLAIEMGLRYFKYATIDFDNKVIMMSKGVFMKGFGVSYKNVRNIVEWTDEKGKVKDLEILRVNGSSYHVYPYLLRRGDYADFKAELDKLFPTSTRVRPPREGGLFGKRRED